MTITNAINARRISRGMEIEPIKPDTTIADKAMPILMELSGRILNAAKDHENHLKPIDATEYPEECLPYITTILKENNYDVTCHCNVLTIAW